MVINSAKSRIQLKNDTEQNWSKAKNFIPLKGEPIIYLADSVHPFSRLKIGDGITLVTELPFINADSTDSADIKVETKEFWDANRDYTPKAGEIIIYLNYKYIEVDGSQVGVAGLKIGDGKAYVIDLPFLNDTSGIDFDQHINNTTIHITNEEREFWNNKINCRDTVISETLFLIRN